MQVNISKKRGRVIKLNKRERDLLDETKRLCAELATVTTQDAAEAFAMAAESIAEGLRKMDDTKLLEAGT